MPAAPRPTGVLDPTVKQRRREMRAARVQDSDTGLYKYNGKLVPWDVLPQSKKKGFKRGREDTTPARHHPVGALDAIKVAPCITGRAAAANNRATLAATRIGNVRKPKRSRLYASPPLTEYELQRQANIEENQRKLAELEVPLAGSGILRGPPFSASETSETSVPDLQFPEITNDNVLEYLDFLLRDDP